MPNRAYSMKKCWLWAPHFDYNISVNIWEKMWETGIKFTFCHNLSDKLMNG